MNDRSYRTIGRNRVRAASVGAVEMLEARAYLSSGGVVLGTPTPITATGTAPIFANLADFNGDGKADLFVANSTDSVSVQLSTTPTPTPGNFGTPSFGAPIPIAVTGTPLPLATGKFVAGSNNLDIVAGTTGAGGAAGDISVILGNGDGTFAAANNIPALANNQAIAVGDFNGDGNQDVITVSNSASNVNNAEILLGNGQGNLIGLLPFSLPFGSVSTVAVGDFNGDGHLDFAVANQLNSSVSIFLGNGDATFKAPVTYKTGPSPTSMVVADFTGQMLANGMSELGIVTANSTGGKQDGISFLPNNGDGTFGAAVASQVPDAGTGGGPLKVRLSNFAAANSSTDLVVLLSPNSSADADILLGNGNGTFHAGASVVTNGGTRNAIAAGDINADGLTDVVLTNSTAITALLNVTSTDNTPPTAMVNATQSAGTTTSMTYDFAVTYTDAFSVDAGTLGAGNLVVTFPGGAQQNATLSPIPPNVPLVNGSTVKAFYRITFPAFLTTMNKGTYSVTLNANSVKNANGVAALAGPIGSFVLDVVPIDNVAPTASVNINQAPATPGSSNYQFTVTYADNIDVKASTVANQHLSVTFPGNVQTQTATLVSVGSTIDAPTISATYQITFSTPLTPAANGGYQVSAVAPFLTDTSMNPLPAGSIGTFTLTVATTPTGAVDSTQAAAVVGTSTYNFTVTYADMVAINTASLGGGNLTVTAPVGTPGAGTPIAASFISNTLPNPTTVDATYQITFPSALSTANNGTYQVTIAANSVTDTNTPAGSVPAGNIGSFAINIPTFVPPSGEFSVSPVTGKLPPSAVTGAKQKAGPVVTVKYNGAAVVSKAVVTVTLYTSSTHYHDSSAVVVGVPIVKKFGKLKPGQSFKVNFKPFLYPGTAGSYFLVSDVTFGGKLDSSDGSTASPITVAAAFVDANALLAAPVKSMLAPTVKASAFLTVENVGNVTYSGPATVDVSVIPAGGGLATVVATVPITLHLTAGQTKKVKLNFTPANLPASGTYNINLNVHLPGDTNVANNAVTSSLTVTI